MAIPDGLIVGILLSVAMTSAFMVVPPIVELMQRRRRSSRRRQRFSEVTDRSWATTRREFFERICAADIAILPALLKRFGHKDKRYLRSVQEQLPGALRGIGASLASGQSLQQAFAYVAKSSPSPMSDELLKVVWDMEAGKDFSEGLANLSARLPIPEVSFLCAAFSVQQRTGGDIHDVLVAASRSLQDAFDLERELQVQTAQARLSAQVVGITPFVLLGALMLITPSYIITFFSSLAGFTVFFVATALDVAGFLWVKRIVSVGDRP